MGLELLRSSRAEFAHPSAALGMQSGLGCRQGCRQGCPTLVCALSVASLGVGVEREGPGQVSAAGHAPHVSIRRGCGAMVCCSINSKKAAFVRHEAKSGHKGQYVSENKI